MVHHAVFHKGSGYRFFCGLMVLLLLCALLPMAALATDGTEAATVDITSTVESASYNKVDIHTAYTDAFFDGDPATYDHGLARATLSLAICSMRLDRLPLGEQDGNIIQFLTDAGYENIRTEGYERETGKDTVATAIATRQVGGRTIVCLSVCSGGYHNEWLSNFTIGTGIRHDGFDYCAGIVEGRLLRYLQEYQLKDNLVLWTGGFSRGAAISNLVAADVDGYGLFDKIFAYCFATPNNTREPVQCPFIFNILGKFDPVTMVPAREWGYGRNGVELYIKAEQTDSDWYPLFVRTGLFYTDMMGLDFTNNPDLSNQLTTAVGCLVSIYPTVEDVATRFQPLLQAAYEAGTSSDPIVLYNTIRNMPGYDISEEELDALVDLFNFISSTMVTYTRGNSGQISGGYWDTKAGAFHNLSREHQGLTYYAWMNATDDPNALFSDSLNYVRLIVEGADSIEVYLDGVLCESTGKGSLFAGSTSGSSDTTGDISHDTLEKDAIALEASTPEASTKLYYQRSGTKTTMILPMDRNYSLSIASSGSEVTITPVSYRAGWSVPSLSLSYTMPAGSSQTGTITFSQGENGSISIVPGGCVKAVPISPEAQRNAILTAEQSGTFHLKVHQVLIFLQVVIGLLGLLLLLALIRMVHRLITKRPTRGFIRVLMIIVIYIAFGICALVISYFNPSNRNGLIEVGIAAGAFTVLVIISNIVLYFRFDRKRTHEKHQKELAAKDAHIAEAVSRHEKEMAAKDARLQDAEARAEAARKHHEEKHSSDDCGAETAPKDAVDGAPDKQEQ